MSKAASHQWYHPGFLSLGSKVDICKYIETLMCWPQITLYCQNCQMLPTTQPSHQGFSISAPSGKSWRINVHAPSKTYIASWPWHHGNVTHYIVSIVETCLMCIPAWLVEVVSPEKNAGWLGQNPTVQSKWSMVQDLGCRGFQSLLAEQWMIFKPVGFYQQTDT